MKEFLKEVEKNDIGKVLKDVFISKYTTYKVGGLVRAIIIPKNTDKLVLLCKIKKIEKQSSRFFSFNDLQFQHYIS